MHVSIVGGGIAGLAVGHYAQKAKISFTIYEASDRLGGNCATFEHGKFLFDSGAHRLHDKDREVTRELKSLLGGKLKRLDLPSQIYSDGKFIDFPLRPGNLLANLGVAEVAKAVLEFTKSRLRGKGAGADLESLAVHTYGTTIARRFLLNYSEKLWGKPCRQLSPKVSGGRIHGLDFKTFIRGCFSMRKARTGHLDGEFYYPDAGFGVIADCLGKACGEGNIRRGSRITRIFHDHERVEAIEVNNSDTIEVDKMVTTLPLALCLSLLSPAPPEQFLALGDSLEYRNLVLVVLFLDRERCTDNASTYFPQPQFPFTRVHEPKNRSAQMSPADKTSLVVEIPCHVEDPVWVMEDAALTRMVRTSLDRLGWFQARDVIDARVCRMDCAYPLLEIGSEEIAQKLLFFLNRFHNLKVAGRNGKFVYAHLHDMMRDGREIVAEWVANGKSTDKS